MKNKTDYVKDMVSVLTPTFNYGHFISDLLESVLIQDYPTLELIVVDDGSTDNTRDVVLSFEDRFRARGYGLTYIRQDNTGQSAAIDNGLKSVHGEYLVWPDADDFYSSCNAISLLVNKLRDSPPDVGVARCIATYIGDNISAAQLSWKRIDTEKEWLFDDSICEKNGFWYLSGGYMVKMECLDKCIPERKIAVARHAGQNYQLLVPIFYHFRCLTVKERLITIRRHSRSHSCGSYKEFDSLEIKFNDFEKVMRQTLRSIPGISTAEAEIFIREHHIKLTREKLRIAKKDIDTKTVRKIFLSVKKENLFRLSIKDKIWFAVSIIPLSAPIIKIYKKMKQ